MKILSAALLLCLSHISWCQTEFISTWEIKSPNESITIPTSDIGEYDFQIDWGDGSVETFVGTDPDPSHEYATAGVKTIKVSGVFPHFHLRNDLFDTENSNADKLLTVEQWGNIEWQSMKEAFYSGENFILNASDQPDLSSVTDMQDMFRYADSFNQDIGDWDVSGVTNMRGIFSQTENFNQDLSAWNVSNAIEMSFMFAFAASFNENIEGWDVSSVEGMEEMFAGAVSFDQDLGSWNVSKVKNMRNIFSYSGLSQTNYDRILIDWSELPTLETGVPLWAVEISYCEGAEARAKLIEEYDWDVFDEGLNCPLSVSEHTIEIYPNPSSSRISISTSETISNLKVFTINGEQVRELTFEESNQVVNLNISDLSSGIYTLILQTQDGGVNINKFVVK